MSDIGTCQYEKGLLFKKTCENPGKGKCIECGIQVCSKHSIVNSSGVFCLDHAPKDEIQNDDWIHDDYPQDDTTFATSSIEDDDDDTDDAAFVAGTIAYQDQFDDDHDDSRDDDWDDFS